jgi:hypothetical protein
VRDHRPTVGKLDPRAIKCIFVGYSSRQKGYKCWCPTERRLFVNMDVTFRETESFYGKSSELDSVFENGSTSACREGENVNGVMVGIIFCPIQVSDGDDEGVSETDS